MFLAIPDNEYLISCCVRNIKNNITSNVSMVHKSNLVFKTNDINVVSNDSIENTARMAFNTVGIKASINKVMNGPVISRVFASLNDISPDQIKLVDAPLTEKTIQMIFGSDKVSISTDPNSKSIVIDVPNPNRAIVPFGNIFYSLSNEKMTLPIALGVDISGNPVAIDLAEAPHMLIAGQTGAGKSVCINSIIMSLIARLSPTRVKLTLIDPKAVELSNYRWIPHLNGKPYYMGSDENGESQVMDANNIITDPVLAINALDNMCKIMDFRKALLAQAGVRSIDAYNKKVIAGEKLNVDAKFYSPLPYHVVIIDEFADLMLTAEKELVSYVSRIAAVGRALGIHIILATQRPSVKVIPGEIKANIPTRIAFKVAQTIDSMTILDQAGAEKLLGKGDMILKFKGLDAMRVHGCFISDEEVNQIDQDAVQEKNCFNFPYNLISEDPCLETDLRNDRVLFECAFPFLHHMIRVNYKMKNSQIIQSPIDNIKQLVNSKDTLAMALFKNIVYNVFGSKQVYNPDLFIK